MAYPLAELASLKLTKPMSEYGVLEDLLIREILLALKAANTHAILDCQNTKGA